MTKQDILNALRAFVNQRPGLEPENYAGHADLYRRDYRKGCLQPLHDFRKLADAVEWRDSLTADDLRDSFSLAFGGRLYLHETNGYAGEVPGSYRGAITYTPGQYGATEYRNAACAVLARALWDHWAVDAPIGQTPREYIEEMARRELGRAIAKRWFD